MMQRSWRAEKSAIGQYFRISREVQVKDRIGCASLNVQHVNFPMGFNDHVRV